jgi:hypothetical protein
MSALHARTGDSHIALDSACYEPYHLLALLELAKGSLPAARQALARARLSPEVTG